MNHSKRIVFGLVLCLLSFSAQAYNAEWYQQKNDTTRKEQPKDNKSKKDEKNKKDEKAKKNEYAELMKKGGSLRKGVFNVRHIEDKWYFEVPDSLLGRYFLCVTRFTAVPQNFGKFSGEELAEATLYFEKRDYKTMVARAFVRTQFADEHDRIYQTLKASTADPIVASFKIIGPNKNKHMNLIDVTSLFKKDNNLMSFSRDDLTHLKLGGLQSDRTYIDTMKVFPINVEVATTRTYASTGITNRSSVTGSVTIGLNTSIVLLPKEPMRRRLWDKRVGYFVTGFTQFSDEQHKTEREAAIARYKLVPKDVKKYLKGELVEPVKPIVYYIDPATPKKWVPYLIQGINDWNVAFEAAGFKNAIQGKEWPNDKNMSVDDARYCVLRYLPAEIENAYGPHIVDPRSGEIIESHICWYHNVMNLLTKWYMTQCGAVDARARTMKFDDKLMGELIRFVSSHEVGHTLGLRHNMGASFATPVEKLRDKAWVEAHGHTISIMDYARFNYVAQPEDNISPKGLFPRINDYDKWAIKWGYQYRPEFKDEFEEKEALMTETTNVLAKNPRLWFGGEGRNEDPRAQTEDLSDNNMKASEYGLKNLKRVLAGLPQWTKQPNGQYDDLEEMYGSVRDQYRRYTYHVLKNVGGRYLNNLPGRKPIELAPTARQREAVSYIGRNVFETPLWLYPSEITERIGFDVKTEAGRQQSAVLKYMMAPTLLSKIYDNSLQASTAYQLPQYLTDLFNIVWKPLSQQSALKASLRRSLETDYIDLINAVVNPKEQPAATPQNGTRRTTTPTVSNDVPLYLMDHLDKVESYVKGQMGKSSGVNEMHYKSLLQKIKLIRDRQTTVK